MTLQAVLDSAGHLSTARQPMFREPALTAVDADLASVLVDVNLEIYALPHREGVHPAREAVAEIERVLRSLWRQAQGVDLRVRIVDVCVMIRRRI